MDCNSLLKFLTQLFQKIVWSLKSSRRNGPDVLKFVIKETPNRSSHRRYSIKWVFLKVLPDSQENTCIGVSFLIKLQDACRELFFPNQTKLQGKI